MGGDTVEIMIDVGPGARLEVRSAAATLVLPNLDDPFSQTLIDADVGDGARLVLALEPTVVAHRARHAATTRIRLAPDAGLRLTERIALGRHGEGPGEWSGRTVVDRAGRPLLRHTVRSSTLLADGARGYLSEVRTDDTPAASGPRSVVLPLAGGGTLRSAWAADLSRIAAQPSPRALPNSV
jgi:urease accessory protein